MMNPYFWPYYIKHSEFEKIFHHKIKHSSKNSDLIKIKTTTIPISWKPYAELIEEVKNILEKEINGNY